MLWLWVSISLRKPVNTSFYCENLEKAMAPHSSTLAWKIPWPEEPGRLQSMGWWRVGHDWATSLSFIGEGNGNPLQCSCLENPRDGGTWWASIYGVAQSRTPLKRLSSSNIRTVAHQASLSMGFSRQEYRSGLPFPSPGDFPNPGIKPRSPEMQVDCLPSEPPGKPRQKVLCLAASKAHNRN